MPAGREEPGWAALIGHTWGDIADVGSSAFVSSISSFLVLAVPMAVCLGYGRLVLGREPRTRWLRLSRRCAGLATFRGEGPTCTTCSTGLGERGDREPSARELGEESLAKSFRDEGALLDPLQGTLEVFDDRQVRREGAPHRWPVRQAAGEALGGDRVPRKTPGDLRSVSAANVANVRRPSRCSSPATSSPGWSTSAMGSSLGYQGLGETQRRSLRSSVA